MERNNKMELPTRDAKHVTEASSYKIFSRNIPNHWIIREVSERDYGIDCYIELVNNQNQVTGELAYNGVFEQCFQKYLNTFCKNIF